MYSGGLGCAVVCLQPRELASGAALTGVAMGVGAGEGVKLSGLVVACTGALAADAPVPSTFMVRDDSVIISWRNGCRFVIRM